MGPRGCLDERAVVAFLEGELAAPERSAVESHLESCPSCTDLLTWAAAEHANGSRAPGNEGRPYIGRLPPGARIDRYQILAAVGRGGMGEVYAAYHPDLDRRIALKVVNESGAGAPEHRARLLREARAIARLSHPNVITVHDAGTVDDRVYIAMEFVEGKTVDAWLRTKTRSWRETLDVFVAAGRGLAAAHAAGVVHRDFKPQNVMIGRDGSVRVMDFGLARLAEEPVDPPDVGNAPSTRGPVPATVTKTGALVGTLAYMAPEQFRGEPHRRARRSVQLLRRAARGAVRQPAAAVAPSRASIGPSAADADASQPSRRSGAPAWLRNVVVRGMSEDRSRRFPSMDALLAAVSRGHTRVRMRAAAMGIGAVVLLLSLGGWRLAVGRHVSCAVPRDRLAAVWLPGDEANPRRQAIHRAFVASGRPTAETVWQRVAKALDDYTTQWSAMHVQTCEATHVHGEQSGEVLDLRMACLTDTLDGVRALTDVLSRADGAMISQAVTAASNLTPLSRCADIPALRSAVPPPRDETTANTVDSLRRSLQGRDGAGRGRQERAALQKAQEVLQQTEATGYKPLLAEVLFLIGVIQCESAPHRGKNRPRESPLRGGGVARRHHGGEGLQLSRRCRRRQSGPASKSRTDGRTWRTRFSTGSHRRKNEFARGCSTIRRLTRLRQGDAAAALPSVRAGAGPEGGGAGHESSRRRQNDQRAGMGDDRARAARMRLCATPREPSRSARSWIRTASTWGTRSAIAARR